MHLEDAMDVDSPGRDAELQAHFARAYQILEQVGRKIPIPGIRKQVSAAQTPLLAVGPDGTVTARSPACSGWLADLTDADEIRSNLTAHSQQVLSDLIRDLQSATLPSRAPAVLTTGRSPRHLVVRAVTAPGADRDEHALLIEPLDFQWSPQAGDMLVKSFGLSPAEVEIVRHLMTGKSLREIAGEMGKSEHTVRNQSKSILSKSGALGQVELIRLVAFLINEEARTGDRAGKTALRDESFAARDGRRVQLFRAGRATGRPPIIFLHGMLDAVAVLEYLSPQLVARGYEVLAPMRPGFGQSDPVLRPETIMDVVTDQIAELIDRENLDRPIVVGHLAGGIYAHVLAHRLRDRVTGAVAISSGVPIVRLSDISSMTKRVRIMAYTARFTPALLPAVLRAGIAMIDIDDIDAFIDAQFPDDTMDRATIRHLELGPWLQSGYRMSVKQGAVGFASDSYWTVRDWGPLITGEAAPVIYLHGAGDHVNRFERMQAGLKGRKGVDLRITEDVGQLLFYERPDLVFAAIDDLSGEQ